MNATVKKYGPMVLVVLGTMLVVNSLAKRNATVAKVKSTIDTGI